VASDMSPAALKPIDVVMLRRFMACSYAPIGMLFAYFSLVKLCRRSGDHIGLLMMVFDIHKRINTPARHARKQSHAKPGQ
jgi:hypothetical protein